jgi:hypothetical protein
MQIQNKIPISDKMIGAGFHHLFNNVDELKANHDYYSTWMSDCSHIISAYGAK